MTPDPPPGFGRLLRAIGRRRDRGDPAIGRLFGPARLLVTAAWARISPRPIVLFIPRNQDLLEAALDLEALLPALGAHRRVHRLPGPAVNPYSGTAPHTEILILRSLALTALAGPRDTDPAPLVVASAAGALWRTVVPGRLAEAAVEVREGRGASPGRLAKRLAGAVYRHEDPVAAPGDFARRGGIVDVFPVDRDRPVRIEFGFEGVAEIREFDVDTQQSGPVPRRPGRLRIPAAQEWVGDGRDGGEGAGPVTRTPAPFRLPGTPGFTGELTDYLRDSEILVEEPDRFRDELEAEATRILDARLGARAEPVREAAAPDALMTNPRDLLSALFRPPPRGAVALGELDAAGAASARPERSDLAARPTESFRNRVGAFVETLRAPGAAGRVVHVFVPGARAAARFTTHLREEGVRLGTSGGVGSGRARTFVHAARLSRSFEMSGLRLSLISGAAMTAAPPRPPRRTSRMRTFRSDFRDLKPGDPVVHTEHGVGRFIRVTRLHSGRDAAELVEIHYARGGKLFLPMDRLDLLEKYSAAGDRAPPLDRLGGTAWTRRKKRVAKAMRDIADELIRLYAARRRIRGHAFSRDTPGMEEFEDAFEWEETEDQIRSIREVFRDMEAEAPMDRLLVGDVGFGKTEVALRAAFKAAMQEKQVAILAPTTVLAAQHLRVFQERFDPFPLEVRMLSRFLTPKQRREVVAGLRDGRVDVVIGTHRLLSKDVRFRDLGLLIVDEEQRFGVSAKERLKHLSNRVDHLAMTATPIPRTLNMSLSGIRDISVIETAPRDRMAIQTHVLPFDHGRIAEAIRHELAREGQVYFVHNRIRSLPAMRGFLEKLTPEARVLTAHGKMRTTLLERTLESFQRGDADVLLTTTIIENGLDLPRVNTLIVNRADAFGLAQLYQIRGRVGRSTRRAYAWLLVPAGAALSETARPRLAALREFSDLGSGFRVAALDLELRGAGNLLGRQQHGHLEAVGFDLYSRLLEEALADARGETKETRCAMKLRYEMRVPPGYLGDVRTRMWLYKRCSAASDLEGLDRLRREVRDRFGPFPEEVEILFRHVEMRVRAEALGYSAVTRARGALVFEAAGPDADRRRFRTPLPRGVGPAEVLDRLSVALDGLEAVASIGSAAGAP